MPKIDVRRFRHPLRARRRARRPPRAGDSRHRIRVGRRASRHHALRRQHAAPRLSRSRPAARPPHGDELTIIYSDDRYVPADSDASNYHATRPLIDALGLPDTQVLRVRTELPLEEAARDYEQLPAHPVGVRRRHRPRPVGSGTRRAHRLSVPARAPAAIPRPPRHRRPTAGRDAGHQRDPRFPGERSRAALRGGRQRQARRNRGIRRAGPRHRRAARRGRLPARGAMDRAGLGAPRMRGAAGAWRGSPGHLPVPGRMA